MEVGRLKSVGKGKQVQMPLLPMSMLPDYHMELAGAVSDAYNFLHCSPVTSNPNLSSSSSSSITTSFTSNSNISFTNSNPIPYYNHDELEINNPLLRSLSAPSSMAAMREMKFRIADLQPINIDPEAVKTPKRKNVRISKDPQSVAARNRRERISEWIRILRRIVPGGTKMDTASMLDEAIHYVKFLKKQVQSFQKVTAQNGYGEVRLGFPGPAPAASGYHDHYMINCDDLMERGDTLCQQGRSNF